MALTHPAFPTEQIENNILREKTQLEEAKARNECSKGERCSETSEPFAIGRSYSLRPGSWDHNTIQNDGWKARCWACKRKTRTHDCDNAATNQSVLVNTLMDRAARREYRMCSGAADIGRVGRGYAAWR